MDAESEEYKIVKMDRNDLKIMLDHAINERWVESYDTIDAYYELDPDGFLKGVIGDEIVATISAVRYPDNFAFLGYYIVKPKYRKKGYGLKIFQKALEHCDGCMIGLDAVQERVESYEKSGFTISTGSIRYIGEAINVNSDLNILNYDENEHFNDIALYDKDCFPSTRSDFLRNWLKIPNAKSIVYYNDKKELSGYASMHETNKGWEISPCYADSNDIAKALIATLINKLKEGDPFIVNVPANNKLATNLIEELKNTYHIKFVIEDQRMYKNGHPDNLNIPKFYSLLSLAVG